ncbi:TonB-dependent receptor [Flavivirga aquatica]|uniref:TonB-dependent receptor n=1 Tax=Flavivirga aquatica TaxID=1849968 RepID=A0A1E5SIY6_9FLAO|nr:outer membrane beta-barrel protein [Flavivirga aquatica]OEJ99097.1 TonB-dependent receptor [Flavivirga aquatica]
MKQIFFTIAFFCSVLAFSQSKSFVVTGTLISEEEKLPLESATIHLERVKDASLVTYTIADKNGEFVLEDKTSDASLNLFISYVGYETLKKVIDISKKDIDLGEIMLKTDSNALAEVVITSTAPITVKKDTLEFNVSSFKTKKNAKIEDLLKKLPGVEVDAQGKIMVNGKDVNKVLVNGKTFFGNDPTITTRNLTKDIIEKIQITDTKTKAEAFSGEEGSQSNKTINFTIKEENNKGSFGTVAAGVGTDDRYEFSGMLNSFNNDRHLSVLAGGNNINSTGFSFGGIDNISTGRRRGRGGFGGGLSQGITTSKNGGFTYGNQIIETIGVNADYFYSGSDLDSKRSSQRENILPDSRYFSNSESNSFSEINNHNATFDLEIELGATLLINITPSFNFSNSKDGSQDDEETLNEDRILTNTSNAFSFSKSNNKSFQNSIDVTKLFGKKGSFLKFDVSTSYNEDEEDSELESKTKFYDYDLLTNVNTLQDSIIRNQIADSKNTDENLRLGVTYRFPLIANAMFLDASYIYNNNKQENKRNTYDFDEVTSLYNDFINTDLSSDFKYTDESNQAGVELVYKKKKLSTTASVNYISRVLDNKDALISERSLGKRFNAIQTGVSFRYKISKSASLNANYGLDNRSPQLSQLQTFKDVSNPLNTIVGNPELAPTNNHRLNLGYRNFNFRKKTSFYAFANGTVVSNQIVSKTTVDENFSRNTTYANVNGNYNLGINTGLRKTIKIDTIGSIRYGVGFRFSTNKNINFNNDVKYASKNTELSPNIRITFTLNDLFELTPNYNLSYTNTSFDIDQFEDQEFLRHSLGLRTATLASKRLDWRNNISYNYNPNVADGFQKSSWFWNSTLSYSMFEDKGTLTLKVYDLLNQNTNARRVASANYIEDSQTNILKRYFMLNFSWKLNKGSGNSNRNNRYYHG